MIPTRTALVTMALLCLLMTACTSWKTPSPAFDTDAVNRYRDSGYRITSTVSIEAHRLSAPPTESPWTVTVTQPKDRARHPMIVYLPGLGESDDAPNHWVESWAHAGYAVLAVQALADDAQVWATPEARSGDFARVARARFADELMDERLARLSTLLTRIRTRSQRGEPGLENLDWSHLALAGADLGAYCVQAIATSPAQRRASISWPIAPRAYLAISPYAVRGSGSASAAVPPDAPVLMISAREDVDAYGVVSDPSVRHLAFDRLGKGDNFYLELDNASHRWLSGATVPAPLGEPPARRPAGAAGADGERGRKRGAGGPQHDNMAPGDDEDDPLQEKGARADAVRAELEKSRKRDLTHIALSEVSFAAVSIAFFDGYVRAQSPARAWLGESAGHWLQAGDRLKHG